MTAPTPSQADTDDAPVRWRAFLTDVLICSLGAYGGPETHMGVFLDQMVAKRRYLSEAELVELMALCSILPGPTSSQTIVSIGYRQGGISLALLTMAVWALPALIGMTLLSFLYSLLATHGISTGFLKYIGPMAVGFILLAAWRIGRKVATDIPTVVLMLAGAVVTYLVRAPWIFPLALLAGGAASIAWYREPGMWNRVHIRPPWRYLALFAVFALGSLALAVLTGNRIAQLFECFYRYGYLVFGGGQVIVPVMHHELVNLRGAMTDAEFLTGYGLVQGMPGPMFSFAAYAGGMAARGGSWLLQLAGAAAGGIGIFLPGLFLIFFVYPVWEDLKRIRAIRISLRGINAVAGGLIAVAAVILMQACGFQTGGLLVTVLTVVTLRFTPIPAPLLVAATLLAGILL
jgi:chromate transporter